MITKANVFGICVSTIPLVQDVLLVNPRPRTHKNTLSIPAVCKDISALVEVSDNSNFVDGDYEIKFSLSGSNTFVGQTTILY